MSRVSLEEEEAALRLASAAVSAKLYRDLADFDNHLDNLAADFTNATLTASIAAML